MRFTETSPARADPCAAPELLSHTDHGLPVYTPRANGLMLSKATQAASIRTGLSLSVASISKIMALGMG